MLLIFPPAAKPSEPPAGIAKLAGALKAQSIPYRLADMNLEGLLYLLGQPTSPTDTWTRRAAKNVSKNISALRDPGTYRSLDRYSRAVTDLNRILEISGSGSGITAGLGDYQDGKLSPVRSADLIRAAEEPENNLFYPYFKKRLPEMIQEFFSSQRRRERRENSDINRKPDDRMIGFSLNYLSQALCTFSMIGFIKREFPAVTIVLGGGLVTSWMKRPGWKSPFGGLVDHLIAGPGEQALLSLLGVNLEDTDHYTPDYDLPARQEYFSPGFILPYSASSGCYWNKCSFCPETAEKNKYISVPVPQAINHLDCLVNKTSPVLVHLLDNAVSPALLRALAKQPPGVPWYGFARFQNDLLDLHFCAMLKKSGCAMLKLGLESGDQGVLDKMQKGIDLDIASRILNNLRRAGIATYIYLLFGTPSETVTEARKTLEFVARHEESITFLNLAIFNMPVCSAEAGEHETAQFYEGDLSLYTAFRHPRGWDRKQVRLFLDSEFKRQKAVASILKNDPPVFTSNHAAFLVGNFRRPVTAITSGCNLC